MHSSKRLIGLAAVAAAAVFAVSACQSGGTEGPPTSSAGFAGCDANPDTCNSGPTQTGTGEITYALEQEFTSWNTTTDEGNAFAGSQALAGVVPAPSYFSPSGTLTWNLDLLVEAPKLTSETPQTWVYKIRPEAVWSDGTQITADDFIFNWKGNSGKPEHCDGCVPASTSGYELMDKVEGSDNGKTVTVTLASGKVYSEWQGLFTLYPAHLAKAAGNDWTTPKGMAAAQKWFDTTVPTWSGGPWKIDKFEKGVSIIQVKNDKWYGKEGPNLSKLIFRFITDQSQEIPALRNNEIQAAGPQPNPDLVTQAGQIPGVQYRIGHGYQHEHFDVNTKNKFLADKELRTAIFSAIDIKEIIEKTYGTFDKKAVQLGSHNFYPGGKYYKDLIGPTGQGAGDVEKAKQILTAAGYTGIGTQLKNKAGETVGPFRLRHTKGNQLRAATMELVQGYLKELGIDSRIEVTETLGATLAERDFDIIIFAWVGSPFVVGGAEQILKSDGGGNYGGNSNPEADALITQAANTLDLDKQADLLNQADALIVKDAYVLEITAKPTFLMVYDKYLNIRDNPTNSGPNYNNHTWGLKAA